MSTVDKKYSKTTLEVIQSLEKRYVGMSMKDLYLLAFHSDGKRGSVGARTLLEYKTRCLYGSDWRKWCVDRDDEITFIGQYVVSSSPLMLRSSFFELSRSDDSCPVLIEPESNQKRDDYDQ